ncbi:MAG: Na+/H+ antiporter subunit D [Verrucomicrobiota bacterium]
MSGLVLVLPLLVPLIGAILLLAGAKSILFQRAGTLFISAVLFGASIWLVAVVDAEGVVALQVGKWEAPFGITLVADRLSAIMVCVSAFMGFSVGIFAIADIDEDRARKKFFPVFFVLLFGVNGAFLTGDLFNLYVWFEVMLIASFVLIALGGKKDELEGAIKYVSLNLFSSALFLTAVGILYGEVGTLNMADLAVKLEGFEKVDLILATSLLLLVAFSIKAALFPFFFWLPASYHTPPVAVSAIFAGLLTKVGVYALIRSQTLVFRPLFDEVQTLLIILAVLTMITGVLGAARHFEMRRILSFHIVSQIGYMILALALMTPLALAAAIFYVVHHIIVKTNLFLVSGIVVEKKGSADLAKIGGLYKSAPWLALLFFIPAFSLGGIPPLSGFWAKFAVVKGGLEVGAWIAVAAALAVGVLTLFSMTKIWAEAFWKEQPVGEDEFAATNNPASSWRVVPVVLLALTTLMIGLFGNSLFAFSERAAEQLHNNKEYISTVLPAKVQMDQP